MFLQYRVLRFVPVSFKGFCNIVLCSCLICIRIWTVLFFIIVLFLFCCVTQDYLLSCIEHGFKSHDQDCGLPLQKLFLWGAEGVLILSCCSLEACSCPWKKERKVGYWLFSYYYGRIRKQFTDLGNG